jgi:geranylgeranyl diphosphate synthase type I
MRLKELLSGRAIIERYLGDVLKEHVRASGGESRLLAPLLSSVREFTLRGGKRFRACLLLAGYHLGGGRDLSRVLPAAAALETFQSWMLIHDDVIDHGETRRGGPTLHVAMARLHQAHELEGSAADFGQGIAITLGDLFEAFTVDLFLRCRVPPIRILAALKEYRWMTERTALGQLLDILNASRPVDEVSEGEVLKVHRLKSAIYTVASPLKLGALLAGAGPGRVQALGAVGEAFGTAFQLRDDVLGVGTQDERAVGKSTNDLFEGKRTLLVVHAWRRAGRDGREALGRVLGNPLATPEQFEQALSVIEETGSFRHSERAIARALSQGNRIVDRLPGLTAADRSLLREIGVALTERTQ